MKSVLSVLNELEATSSRNEKLAILKANEDVDDLKNVLCLALNPLVNFYIRKIPAYKPAAKNQADSLGSVLDSLSVLTERQVTGNAAIEFLTKLLSSLVKEDAEVLERVIEKDLKCGVAAGIVNAVWKNLIPDYPCMLASAYDKKLVDKIQYPAIVQTKMDGMRFNAIVKNGAVEYRSRNGKEIQIKNDLLDAAFRNLAVGVVQNAVVFDGELLVVNDFGKPLDRKTGNGILNKAVKGTITEKEAKQIRAVLWDFIPLERFDLGFWKTPYAVRLQTLKGAVDAPSAVQHLVSLVKSWVVQDLKTVQKKFQDALDEGEEGVILKSLLGVWENKRSRECIKFKSELDCDLKIVGVQLGTGKYKGLLGAIQCQSEDGILKVDVGSGFTDADRKELINEKLIGRIVSVKYNAKIENVRGEQSLFLPIFLELREDKTEADTWAQIK